MELKMTAARISMARSAVGPAFGVVKRHFLTFQLFALTLLFSPSNRQTEHSRHSQLTGREGRQIRMMREIDRYVCAIHTSRARQTSGKLHAISLAIYPIDAEWIRKWDIIIKLHDLFNDKHLTLIRVVVSFFNLLTILTSQKSRYARDKRCSEGYGNA